MVYYPPEDMDKIVLVYLQEFGPIDILVSSNDLGIPPRPLREEMDKLVAEGKLIEDKGWYDVNPVC